MYHKLVEVTDLPKVTPEMDLYLDTETTGLDTMQDVPFLLLLGLKNPGKDTNRYAVGWTPKTAMWCTDHLSTAKRLVAHNAKYDYHMLRNGGVNHDVLYSCNWFCTMVIEAMLDEHRFRYDLDSLGMDHFGKSKKDGPLLDWLASKFPKTPKSKLMSHIQEAPREMVAYYGIGDIELTEELFAYQQVRVSRLKDTDFVRLIKMEMKCLPALAEIEHRGVHVNTKQVDVVDVELTKKQHEAQRRIIDMVGFEVNPRSPLSMVKAFQVCKIPVQYNKTTKKPTFAAAVLDEIDHPFTKALKESRGIKTMLDNFINSGIRGHLRNGKIHTNFNQLANGEAGTKTGRLSSSDPNLQQIPKRDGELAPMIRSLFVPPKGKLWISNDWEQFEFRLFAHFVGDPDLTATYLADPTTDFHQVLSDTTGVPRGRAKRINLGLVFGMGEGKLAQEVGLPYEIVQMELRDGTKMDRLEAGPEAKALFADYHAKFPRAKAFLDEKAVEARARMMVRSIMGRHLHFPRGTNIRKAGGLIFQSSAADIMKEKIITLNNEYRKSDVDFVLVVHDEFCLCTPDDLAEATKKRVKEITEDVPLCSIPILANPGIGPDWWEASK